MQIPVHDCRVPSARSVGMALAKALLDDYGNERMTHFQFYPDEHRVQIFLGHKDLQGATAQLDINLVSSETSDEGGP